MENIKFKKRLGQNFLKDEKVLKKIYESINVESKDLIIEIGPGNGALTKWLQKYNAIVIAYEIDMSLKVELDKIVNDKTIIVYQDFLDANLDKIKEYQYNNIYVIANIPYYITTPIINKIINSNLEISSLTLMVQEEVANRLSATPKSKNYGYITVLLNNYYNINKLFVVDKSSFYPIPKVDSAVISLAKKETTNIDFNKFNNLIKKAFQFKRKKLKNNLFNYDLKLINRVLNKYGYSIDNRAEEIPYEIYCEITKNI